MILPKIGSAKQDITEFEVATDCQAGQERTGHDLLARGDFEAHDLFEAADRSWLDLDSRVSVTASHVDPADNVMRISLGAEDSVLTGMRKFQRVFKPGTPMSVRADLSASSATEIEVYLQIRATGQSLEDGLKNGKKILIGSRSLGAGEVSKLDLDFDTPRTRARSIRLLIRAKTGEKASTLELDDLQLIEWHTPFQSDGSLCSRSSPPA